MHRTFLDLNQVATASRTLDPSMAAKFKHTMVRFSELAKSGIYESFDCDETDRETSSPTAMLNSRQARDAPDPPGRREFSQATTTSEALPPWGYGTTFEATAAEYDGETFHFGANQQPGLPHSGWDATEPCQTETSKEPQIPGEVPNLQYLQTNQKATPQQDLSHVISPSQKDAVGPVTVLQDEQQPVELQQYQVHLPGIGPVVPDFAPKLGKELPLPSSFASQEGSFARRLIRSSYEAGVRLFSDPNADPEALKNVSEYAFCFTNASILLRMMSEVTKRAGKDNLEKWDVPLYHVGNAGLHYPRDGIDATTARPDWWANQGFIGPFQYSRAASPVPQDMRITEIPEYVGVGGEWFDSNDVEQYLQRKGLVIDGQSSLIEIVEPDGAVLPDLSPDTSQSSFEILGGPQSPPAIDSFTATDPFQQDVPDWSEDFTNFANVPELNMDFSYTDQIFADPKPFDPQLGLGNSASFLPTHQPKPRKLFDVEKFVDSEYSPYHPNCSC